MKLNLGCWCFYHDGWTNVDIDRGVRADLYEDCERLPSIQPNSVSEIYAGHLLEHVIDVEETLKRWRYLMMPGAKLTVTVPDCVGTVVMWHSGQNFPGINVGPDEGLVAVAAGQIKPGPVLNQTYHRRVFDLSTLSICLKYAGFRDIRAVDNHSIMVCKCSDLGWQIALECLR
jgi:hypothetical protein